MEREATGKTYKMKGHTLPGINQRLDATATNVAAEGLAGSSAFQQDMAGMMNTARGMTQNIQRQRNPITPGGGAMGGVGAGVTMPPPTGVFPLKPSVAKIYNKSKLTKEVLK